MDSPDPLSTPISLSSVALRRSSSLHTVSAQSNCILVLAGRPCERVYRSTSLMCSSLLLQQCLACLVCLPWIVFVIGGRTATVLWGVASKTYSIQLAAFLCNCCQAFLLVSVHLMHPYNRIDTTAAWKNVLFYRSRLTSIWPIFYWLLSMTSQVACWCHSRLMRRCFRNSLTCPLVSENPLLGGDVASLIKAQLTLNTKRNINVWISHVFDRNAWNHKKKCKNYLYQEMIFDAIIIYSWLLSLLCPITSKKHVSSNCKPFA